MKSNKYKNLICEFPSINTNYNSLTIKDYLNSSLRPNTQAEVKKLNLTCNFLNGKEWNKTFSSNFKKLEFERKDVVKNFEGGIKKVDLEAKKKSFSPTENLLFKKIKKIENLGVCQISFFIQNKK